MEPGYQGRNLEPKTITGHSCAHMGLHEAIDVVISKFPSHIAVSCKSISLTYSELDTAATDMAKALLHLGVRHGDAVAILMHRSEKMIVSLLAILKVGACYVPIDPGYPKERVDFILKETKANVLILGKTTKYESADFDSLVVLENSALPVSSPPEADKNDKAKISNIKYKLGDLAYIIYTSGSTGLPKGVQVTHSNVHNYAFWAIREFGMSANDTVDFSSTLAFDISVRATIVPLLAGAKIQICSEEEKELPHKYLEYLGKNDISLMTVTPSYFASLTKLLGHKPIDLNLQKIWLIGETSISSDVKAWMDHFPEHQIINEYGPTEATVGILAYRVLEQDPYLNASNLPVGTPAYNTTIYILDKTDQPCDIGEPGQICISGSSVSQGYLNRPELNSSVFIENPFQPSEILYKTGDLGRKSTNGHIEHLGRLDRQIKVRGFRVELGDVEASLKKHTAINFATVSPYTSSNEQSIVAYILTTPGFSASDFELKQYLKKHLPEYMIPSRFIYLDKVPLTVNGKLDRSALPAVESLESCFENVKPKDNIEEIILAIWHSVLGNQRFGVTETFSLLGGESFSAAQIVQAIETKFSVSLPLKKFYNFTTVRALSEYIRAEEVNKISDNNSLLSALSEVESMSIMELNKELDK